MQSAPRRNVCRELWLILAVPGLLFASEALAEASLDEDTTHELQPAAASAIPVGAARPLHETPEAQTPRVRAPKLNVRSSSVLVVDAVDSSVLYSKQPQRVVPIASITKLMSALVVLEAAQPLDEKIRITADDCRLGKDVVSRLVIGTELTRGDLLRLALMSSENRAAQTLARNYPGGLNAFVRAMNTKARALGMKTARFADPTGLSNRNVSSAADLAKLVAAAASDPSIREFSTFQSYTVPVRRQLIEFRNTNTLVNKADWSIQVQKTGYTQAAGQCLVMQATIRERPVVMVLLNSFGKYTRVADARRIRKWLEASAQEPQLAQAAH